MSKRKGGADRGGEEAVIEAVNESDESRFVYLQGNCLFLNYNYLFEKDLISLTSVLLTNKIQANLHHYSLASIQFFNKRFC